MCGVGNYTLIMQWGS